MKKLVALPLTLICLNCCTITALAAKTLITPAEEYQKITAEKTSTIQPPVLDEGELHQLVFASASQIELSDSSIWNIGSYWSASDWRSGEVIRITYETSTFWFHLKIDNLSRNETVWSTDWPTNPKRFWDVKKKETRKITAIKNNIFTLDDGKQYKVDANYPHANTWQIGDPVFVMRFQNNRDYYLLNGTSIPGHDMGGVNPIIRDIVAQRI